MTSRCCYCHQHMLRGARGRRRHHMRASTRDHVIPKAHPEFPGDLGNIIIACFRCNNARGSAPYESFHAFAVEVLRPKPSGSVAKSRPSSAAGSCASLASR